MLAGQGLDITRAVLAFWVGYAAAELKPVYVRLRELILASGKIAVDETVAPVLDPGRGRTSRATSGPLPETIGLWGGTDPPAIAFSYAPGRGAVHGLTLLEGYRGIVQAMAIPPTSSGIIAATGGGALTHRDLIVALAARRRLPAIYAYREHVMSGGLISYGLDNLDQFRRAAGYVDRIIRVEKPADLPVQAPTKYELVINRKTAKALGLDVSPSLLARADEVIE
jgi:hypothetical protein